MSESVLSTAAFDIIERYLKLFGCLIDEVTNRKFLNIREKNLEYYFAVSDLIHWRYMYDISLFEFCKEPRNFNEYVDMNESERIFAKVEMELIHLIKTRGLIIHHSVIKLDNISDLDEYLRK